MTDISRHPLLKQAYDVCQAIEQCGASVALTNAVTKASDLMRALDEHIEQSIGRVVTSLKVDIDSSGLDSLSDKCEALRRAAKLFGGEAASEGQAEAIQGVVTGFGLDPLEQAIEQAARLVTESNGELAVKLSRHLDSLLDAQLKAVAGAPHVAGLVDSPSVMRPEAGDVLVFKVDEHLARPQYDRLSAFLAAMFGATPASIVVLQRGEDLQLVKKA